MSFTYRAFISYAHADRAWAVWLHRALERYRVPRRLAGAEDVRRLGRMFRDEEELAAAAELGPKIDAALKASDVLIVVCSPRSAKSRWVNQEIEAFKARGREHRVFALIVDGEPHGEPDAQGDPTECFPLALKATAAGGVAEPLAADVRKFGREDAAVRLIAGMLDVGYDDLRQREVRRRRAEMLRAQALFATGLALIVAALTGGYFAASNYIDASERRSDLYAREATALMADGDFARAMLVGLYGDPAAQAGPVEQLLKPGGFASATTAISLAMQRNELLERVTVSEDPVLGLGYSKDGSSLVVGTTKEIVVWPIEGGEPRRIDISDGRYPVTAVTVSPRGDWGVVQYDRLGVMLYKTDDLVRGPVLDCGVPELADAVVAFSADGNVVACSGNGRSTAISFSDNRRLESTPQIMDGLRTSLAVDKDGKALVIGDSRNNVTAYPLRDSPTNLDDFIWSQHGQVAATEMAISPDGELLATGGRDGLVIIRRMATGQEVATLQGLASPVSSLAYSPDGKLILAGFENGKALLWVADAPGSPELQVGGNGSPVSAVAFHPAKLAMATAGKDGVLLWPDIRVSMPEDHGSDFEEEPARELSFSEDEKTTLARYDSILKVRRAGTGDKIEFSDGRRTFIASALSRDGARVAGAFDDGSIKVWPAKGGEAQVTLQGPKPLSVIAFSPDGSGLLAGGGNGGLALLPLRADAKPANFVAADADVTAMAFAGDGRTFVTGHSDGRLRVWPATGGSAKAEFGVLGPAVGFVAMSRNGERLLAAPASPSEMSTSGVPRPAQVRVWSSGGQIISTFNTIAATRSVALSADGNLAVTGEEMAVVEVWLANSGTLADGFQGVNQVVSRLVNQDVVAAKFSAGGEVITVGTAQLDIGKWLVSPILTASPQDRVSMVCAKLAEINVKTLTNSDYERTPILERDAPHPCAKVWRAPARPSFSALQVQACEDEEFILFSRIHACSAVIASTISSGVRARPQLANTYFKRGKAYEHSYPGDAIEDYGEAIRLDPGKAAYHAARASLDGQYQRTTAIADYTEAIRLEPKNASYLRSRGDLFEAAGDHERAIADYSGALKIAPGDADLLLARCEAHLAKGDFGRAVEDCSAALQVRAGDELALLTRGTANFRRADMHAALKDFEVATVIAPENAMALYGRGVVRMKLGQADKGKADIENADKLYGSAEAEKGMWLKPLLGAQAADTAAIPPAFAAGSTAAPR